MITQYNVGLVISQIGITDRQLAWFMAELKHRASLLVTDGDKPPQLTVYVPGFSILRRDQQHGIPSRILNQPLPEKCKLVVVECPGSTKSIHGQIMGMMLMMDEVWCMPTYGQIHALSRGRPAVVYRAGQREGKDASKFKWVVPWVETNQPADKQKKGKKNAKPTYFRT